MDHENVNLLNHVTNQRFLSFSLVLTFSVIYFVYVTFNVLVASGLVRGCQVGVGLEIHQGWAPPSEERELVHFEVTTFSLFFFYCQIYFHCLLKVAIYTMFSYMLEIFICKKHLLVINLIYGETGLSVIAIDLFREAGICYIVLILGLSNLASLFDPLQQCCSVLLSCEYVFYLSFHVIR